MKVKVTEIEATAEELRASNSVADGILNLLKGVFTPLTSYEVDDEDELMGEVDKISNEIKEQEKSKVIEILKEQKCGIH